MEGKWTIKIVRGILAIILWNLMFLNLEASVLAVLVILGVYAIVDGIFKLGEVYLLNKKQQKFWHTLLAAVVSFAVGISIFSWPGITAVILIALIAAQILIQGISDIYAGISEHKNLSNGRFWLLLIGGVAQVLFGLWMIAQPVMGGLTLTAIIAAYTIVISVILIIHGIEEKIGGPGPSPVALA